MSDITRSLRFLFAILLALTPCGCRWSVDNLLHRKRHGHVPVVSSADAWAVRLIQIQLTMIYVSTAWEKLNGEAWLDGTALYYASRLDDLFGRGPVPSILFNSLVAMKWMTWAVLFVEVALPIALWFRETRPRGSQSKRLHSAHQTSKVDSAR